MAGHPDATRWTGRTSPPASSRTRSARWTGTCARPLTEFFAKFTPPKSQSKLTSRLKCNVYYYRANYFCILVGCFLVAFFRNPWALVACAMACFSLLCANDSFAQSFSERATRTVRKYYPPAAAWMRRSAGQAGVPSRPYARVKLVHICGFRRARTSWPPRASSACGCFGALAVDGDVGAGMVPSHRGGHASARSPNLKARLSRQGRVQGGVARIQRYSET